MCYKLQESKQESIKALPEVEGEENFVYYTIDDRKIWY